MTTWHDCKPTHKNNYRLPREPVDAAWKRYCELVDRYTETGDPADKAAMEEQWLAYARLEKEYKESWQ